MGQFHPANQHNGSEDATQWEKVHLKHTLFGRDIWHCLNSNIFGIWSVVERCPIAMGPHHVYLQYACGRDFLLTGANMRIEAAKYNPATDHSKEEISGRFQIIYNQPFRLEGEAANSGYMKRSVAEIDIPEIPGNGTHLCYRMTIEANMDNQNGEQPHMRDFFLEGFSLYGTGGMKRVKPPTCVIF